MERRTVYATDVADLISKEFDIPFADLVDVIGRVPTAKANIDTEKLKDNVCNGCIYLKGTLEECRKWCDLMTDIDNAPTVEPKKGKWIEDFNRSCCYCSLCGWEYFGELDAECMTNFCPNCGADMRGENDGK